MIGERGLNSDRLILVLNIPGTARRQLELLNAQELNFFQRYINGLNAYISNHGA